MFKLLRFFSIFGGLTIAVFTLALSAAFISHERLQVVQAGEEKNILLGRALSNALRPEFTALLQLWADGAIGTEEKRLATAAFSENLAALAADLPILEAVAFAPDRRIVYSTDTGEIGEIAQMNDGLAAAYTGTAASEMSLEEEAGAFSQRVFDVEVVETYLPVFGPNGEVIAAFELYTDVSDLLAAAYQRAAWATALLFVAFGVLFFGMRALIARANGVLTQQYGELEAVEQALSETNARLEDTVAARTARLQETVATLEDAEREARRLFKAVEQSPASILLTDLDGQIDYVNPTFLRRSGYQEAEVLGKSLWEFKSPSMADAALTEVLEQVKNGGEWTGELLSVTKDGSSEWEEVGLSTLTDAEGTPTGYLVVKEDISKRKQHEEQLIRQATYDDLTGLANRLLAGDRLDHAIQRAERRGTHSGLIFIDLDNFKTVNDTLGHASGDEMLTKLAERLTQSLTATGKQLDEPAILDATIARMGGDEFTVILPELSNPMLAETVAEQLLKALDAPVHLGGREVFATASMGIAIYPQDGSDAQELMRNADAAMYHAKADGKNRFHFFTADMNQKAMVRLELDGELHRALERGELTVMYQPIIDNATRRLIGGEALLRWNNARFGNVPPPDFISLAEDTGLIDTIGAWCLNQACHAAMSWTSSGAEGPYVSVNVSSRQLQDPDFDRIVRQALTESGLSPSRLVLELTESAILGDSAIVEKNLSELRRCGVRFAIDDFGTGYSSLSYLRRFTFDILKVDRSFISGVASVADDESLVRAIVAMARSLKLSVVAEGVETNDQLALISQLGCQTSQGWLFAKAMAPEDFKHFAGAQAATESAAS